MKRVQLTERFECALIFANRLHAGQVRKISGVPYFAHLLSVAALVLEDGGTEDEAIAALLHDAIEDQGGRATRERIQQQFGETVVGIVEGCTESDQVPKSPWQERKMVYLAKMRSASASVQRVSLADKIHNLRSLLHDLQQRGDVTWSYFNASPAELLWFYQSLLEIYQETGTSRMTKIFRQLVWQLEAWMQTE